MDNFIDTCKWSKDIEKKILGNINAEKDNLKLDVLVECWAKLEIDEICLGNVDEISKIRPADINLQLEIRSALMKLSFDLWRDFDFYKDFTFKTKFTEETYISGLKELKYELTQDRWVATDKVHKTLVMKNIIKYIICFSIWKQKKRMQCETCSYCDTALKYASVCNVCDTGISDMLPTTSSGGIESTSEDLAKVKDFWTCQNCCVSNDFKNDICTECKHKGPHFKKWLCDQCHFINHPHNWVCSVCFEANTYLKFCHLCQALRINSKHEDACSRCIAELNIRCSCTNRAKHRLYGTKEMSCKKCKICPFEPPNINETIFIIPDTEVKEIEMWRCTYCQEYISIDESKCPLCLNWRYCDNRILCYFCGNVNICSGQNCVKCKEKLVVEKPFSKGCIIS